MQVYSKFKLPPSVGLDFVGSPSLCQTQYKHSCDINRMIERVCMGDNTCIRPARYIDAIDGPDSYYDAQCILANAQSIWHDMPEQIKAVYGSADNLLAELNKRNANKSETNQSVSDQKPNDPSNVTAKADVSTKDTAHASNT